MAWSPISGSVVQRVKSDGKPASGYILKLYAAGTSTNTPISTDETGATQANYATYNSNGDVTVSGNVVIPHIDQDYKIAIYPSLAAANADSGAVFTTPDISVPNAVSLADLGITSTAAELNKLDGATVSAAEINHLAGVTSAVQAQINAKAAGVAASVDNEIALFGGTGGKTLKRASQTGVLVANSGVIGTAVSGTDFKTIAGASILGPGNISVTSSYGVYLSTVTAVSASQVDIETGFSTDYDDYIIIGSNVSLSATDSIFGRIKTGGSYITTSTYLTAEPNGPVTTTTTTYAVIIQSVTSSINIELKLFAVNSSAKKGGFSTSTGQTSAPGALAKHAFWANTNTGTIQGFRFYAGSGATITGTFKLYGVRIS